MLYEELSKTVLDGVFAVHPELGPGLLEQPYHNALYMAFRELGCTVRYEQQFEVLFRGEVVGEYYADLVVNGCIVVEVKAVAALNEQHEAQLLNYLRISGCNLGYVVNFAPRRVEFMRRVLSG